MILIIRTDNPQAELALYKDRQPVVTETWEAHRQLAETIHIKIVELLKQADCSWQDLTGIVAYQGPGSFTGLRIGLSVANALAFSLKIPITGQTGSNWQSKGLNALQAGQGQNQVLPEYGAPVHITQQKR